MIEFIQNNIPFILFILFLTVFLYVKRKNLVVSGPFPFFYMMMYKTTWGLDKMNRWAHKHPRLFLWLAYLCAFVGIVGMFASFIFMFWQLGFIFDNQITEGGGLVLPIQTDSGLSGAVPVFYVPFLYWIIALFILAVVHEFAHGVIAERFKVKIKSSGFAFMGIIAPLMPAAFVEPDEKELNKVSWWKKVAVMGAGSTSNFIFGFLFLAVWIFVAFPLIYNTMELDTVSFNGISNQSDFNNYNITSGTITHLNNEEISTLDYLVITQITQRPVALDFYNFSNNETLTFKLENQEKEIEIVTKPHPQLENRGMIGIENVQFNLKNSDGFSWLGNFPLEFERIIFWIWFLNISIGIMNLLPLWITDGGQVAKTIFPKFLGENIGIKVYHLLSWLVLIMIFFTMKPQFLFNLFGLN